MKTHKQNHIYISTHMSSAGVFLCSLSYSHLIAAERGRLNSFKFETKNK